MKKSHFVILQYQFPVTFPYSEGQPLTAHEANVFNHHRSDLIRKIARRWVIEAVNSSPNEILSIEELDALTTRIIELDRKYEYSLRDDPLPSQLEYQLTLVATQAAKQIGLSSPHEINRLKHHPDVQKRAREIILAGKMSFEDLLS